MPRIRTIKPSFFRSYDVVGLSYRARLTWIGLWTYVDDEGRGRDDARIIKGDLWALEDDVTWRDVEDDLMELSRSAHVVRYEVSGRHFLHIPTWLDHQVISRPTRSKFPAPEDGVIRTFNELPEDSVSNPGLLPAGSGTGNREMEQGTGKGSAPQAASPAPKKRASRIPDPFPITPEMVEWAKGRVPGLDGQKSTESFELYWQAKSGKDATKLDWVATWKRWLISDFENGQNMLPNAPRPVTGRQTRGQERDAELMDFMTKADGQASRQEITS